MLRRDIEPHEAILTTEMTYQVEGGIILYNGHEYPTAVVAETGEVVPEAYLHDDRQMPHMMPGNLDALFPRICAAEGREEEPEADDWLEMYVPQTLIAVGC